MKDLAPKADLFAPRLLFFSRKNCHRLEQQERSHNQHVDKVRHSVREGDQHPIEEVVQSYARKMVTG